MKSRDELCRFMENHIYVVWDFMCLLQNLKRLAYQHSSGSLWQPPNMMSYRSMRMLNEIILSEETDVLPDGVSYSSHLDIYLQAMREVGANTIPFETFLKTKDFSKIPEPALSFVRNTFEIIHTNKIHILASSFAYGRELIIPSMFIDLLNSLKIEAPMFKYYLNRHIEVDGNEHGPMSNHLVEELIDEDPIKRKEVEWSKDKSIRARERLWEELNL